MADHGARDHATWSASATARNVHCPGALALARFAPPDKESIHAARGTACHQISEKCLRTGAEPSSFLGSIEKTKEHEIEIDEELVSSAEAYVEYCRAAMTGDGHWIEEKFSLASLSPPFDAGGTGDFVSYDAVSLTLEVVDLKNGMGVVDVNDNPQLRTYGLGALLKHPELKVSRIVSTVVQPRAQHRDGRIRSETYHVADLLEWTSDLLDAMRRSKAAMDAFDTAGGNTVLLDEWAELWLRPGKCTFCPVEGTCPALRKKALAAAEVWFDEVDQPRIGNLPGEMSPEKMGETLDMLPMLEDWIKAVRALAHTQAEQGVQIPGYQLVDKIGNRAWLDRPDIVAAVQAATDLDSSDLYVEPKLKSPAQMEKLLGAKRKALIEPFVHRPITGTNLVSQSRTTRPPARSSVEKFLDHE